MAMLKAREAAMRQFRPLLAEHDLTEQQWRVLRSLASAHEPLEVGEVAASTFLLGPSLSRILANLEDRGLVARTDVADDLRKSAISLTEAGHSVVAEVAPASEAIYGQIERAYGADRLQRLLTELADFATIDLDIAPRTQEAS